MKVFISWSGDVSKQIAEALNGWLPQVIQSIEPFYSPHIEKGTRWATEISAALQTTSVGIVCLTPNNQSEPWIQFEAGAIAKQVDQSRLCPLLFGFQPSDMKPSPLTQFQVVPYSKQEMKRLMNNINADLAESALSQERLDASFEIWWPTLDDSVKIALLQKEAPTQVNVRSPEEMIAEILELTRANTTRPPAVTYADDPQLINAIASLMSSYKKVVRSIDSYAQGNSKPVLDITRVLKSHLDAIKACLDSTVMHETQRDFYFETAMHHLNDLKATDIARVAGPNWVSM